MGGADEASDGNTHEEREKKWEYEHHTKVVGFVERGSASHGRSLCFNI